MKSDVIADHCLCGQSHEDLHEHNGSPRQRAQDFGRRHPDDLYRRQRGEPVEPKDEDLESLSAEIVAADEDKMEVDDNDIGTFLRRMQQPTTDGYEEYNDDNAAATACSSTTRRQLRQCRWSLECNQPGERREATQERQVQQSF